MSEKVIIPGNEKEAAVLEIQCNAPAIVYDLERVSKFIIDNIDGTDEVTSKAFERIRDLRIIANYFTPLV